jgi:hypothetical protein
MKFKIIYIIKMKYISTDPRIKFPCGNPKCKTNIRQLKHTLDKLGFVCYECSQMSFIKRLDAIVMLKEQEISDLRKVQEGFKVLRV